MKKLCTLSVFVAGLMIPMAFTVHAEPPFGHERHPEIHSALRALENARNRMMKADHDFGGHRDAALLACEAAIEQLRLALQYDR